MCHRIVFTVIATIFSIFICCSAQSANAQTKPNKKSILPTEKLAGKPIVFTPNKFGTTVRATVWFNEQFLGDGKAYQRRAKEFAKSKRGELRSAVVKTLKALSEKSYKAAKKKLDLLKKRGIIRDLERHWIVNGFSCRIDKVDLTDLEEIPGVRAVFVRPAGRKVARAGQKSKAFPKAKAPKFDPAKYKHPWYTRSLMADHTWKKLGVTGKGTLNVVHDFNFVYSDSLLANIHHNPKEIPNNGKDDDGNSLVDDCHGWNFPRNSANLTQVNVPLKAANPRAMHGYMCANIICGRGTKKSPYEFGLAPEGKWAGVIGGNRIEAAVEWAIEQGADTYSMSFSMPNLGEYRSHWRKVMEHGSFCGVCFVSGAGNFAQSQNIPVQMRVPEDIPTGVFAATGVQRNFARTPFSSKGPVEWNTHFYKEGRVDRPDVCAFNMGLPLLKRDGTVVPVAISGNSFAGPSLAGSLALMMSADPDLLPWDARQIITSTATDVAKKGFDYETGHGLINCYRAVKEVLRRKAVREGKNAKPYEGREKGDELDIAAIKKKLTKAITVARVVVGGEAAKAGVKAGDVLVSYNGKKINSRQDLMAAKKAAANKDSVPVVIERDGNSMTVKMGPGPLGIFPQFGFREPVFK